MRNASLDYLDKPLRNHTLVQTIARALRYLGVRWLKILCAMLRNKTPCNGELHARNQASARIVVLQLQPVKTHAT